MILGIFNSSPLQHSANNDTGNSWTCHSYYWWHSEQSSAMMMAIGQGPLLLLQFFSFSSCYFVKCFMTKLSFPFLFPPSFILISLIIFCFSCSHSWSKQFLFSCSTSNSYIHAFIVTSNYTQKIASFLLLVLFQFLFFFLSDSFRKWQQKKMAINVDRFSAYLEGDSNEAGWRIF